MSQAFWELRKKIEAEYQDKLRALAVLFPEQMSGETYSLPTGAKGAKEKGKYFRRPGGTAPFASSIEVEKEAVIPKTPKIKIRRGHSRKRIEPPSKQEMEDLYLKQELNGYEIARIKGVSELTVYKWLDEYGIPKRSRAEAAKIRGQRRFGSLTLKPETYKYTPGVQPKKGSNQGRVRTLKDMSPEEKKKICEQHGASILEE